MALVPERHVNGSFLWNWELQQLLSQGWDGVSGRHGFGNLTHKRYWYLSSAEEATGDQGGILCV